MADENEHIVDPAQIDLYDLIEEMEKENQKEWEQLAE